MKSQIGSNTQTAEELQKDWDTNPRWAGIKRDYTAEDVVRLRGSITEDSTLARRGAENLWDLLHTDKWVAALGALTGNQAVQQVKAGLKAIYLSGWQVAEKIKSINRKVPVALITGWNVELKESNMKDSGVDLIIKGDKLRVRNIPVLAQILTLGSLRGFADTLNGSGIEFADIVVPVRLRGPAPAPGTEIRAGEIAIGAMGSASGERGLAMIRTDRAEVAIAAGQDLVAGACILELLPANMP
jgi:hypothetical protein